MSNFRELNVWKSGMEITKEVYSLRPELPDYEKFGLRIQLVKASILIPSNIAEGCGKSIDKDFRRYLEISLGSAYELETQVILTSAVHGIVSNLKVNKVQEEQKMLTSLIKTLNN